MSQFNLNFTQKSQQNSQNMSKKSAKSLKTPQELRTSFDIKYLLGCKMLKYHLWLILSSLVNKSNCSNIYLFQLSFSICFRFLH